MTDEIQNDEIETEVEAQAADTEAPIESPSESSPENTLSPGVQKRLATLTRRAKEAERKVKQLEGSSMVSNAVEGKAPEVPEAPNEDLWLTDAEEAKRLQQEHAKGLRELGKWEAKQEVADSEKARKQETDQKAKRDQQVELVNTYAKRALKAGLNEDKLAQNESVLSEMGVSSELAIELYSDEDGPQIVDYLAKNYDALADLADMPITQAIRTIERDIRAKALSRKPVRSNAPDPIEPTNSTSSVPDEWGQLAGGYTFS